MINPMNLGAGRMRPRARLSPHADFDSVVGQYCHITGRADKAGAIRSGEHFDVLGLRCRLLPGRDEQAGLVFLQCCMGTVDPADQARMYRDVLQHDFYLFNGGAPLFALDAQSGELTCLAHAKLEGLDGAGLHALLVRVAGMVRVWQQRPCSREELAGAAVHAVRIDPASMPASWRPGTEARRALERAVMELDFHTLKESE